MHYLANNLNINLIYWLPEFKQQVEGIAPVLMSEMNEIFKRLFQIELITKKWIQLIQNADYIHDDSESHFLVIWKLIKREFNISA